MINIACVKAGRQYSDDYVMKLYNSVKRNLTVPFHFYLFSDNDFNLQENMSVNRLTPFPSGMPKANKLWWYKLYMFDKKWDWKYPHTLYFDLDTVIINSIDHFVDYHPDKFCILQDFNRHHLPSFDRWFNSSIMKWPVNQYHEIYDEWFENYMVVCRQNQGDQNYITKHVKGKHIWWPRTWAMSYKWELLDGGVKRAGMPLEYKRPDTGLTIPDDCSVIVFHGKPNPCEVEDSIILQHWR